MKKQILVLSTLAVLVLIAFLPSGQTKGQPPDSPASQAPQALECVPNNSDIFTELVDICLFPETDILKGKFYYPVPKDQPPGTYYANNSLGAVYLAHGIGGKVIGSIENCLLLFL